MNLNSRNGETARDFRPFTDRGTLAHFLDGLDVGQSEIIETFTRMDGNIEKFARIQCWMTNAKAPGTKYMTRTTPDGLLITRLA